jgi:magnesium-transporting ATPase (P-type)
MYENEQQDLIRSAFHVVFVKALISFLFLLVSSDFFLFSFRSVVTEMMMMMMTATTTNSFVLVCSSSDSTQARETQTDKRPI